MVMAAKKPKRGAIKFHLPRELYLQMAARAGSLSRGGYLLTLVCRDLGLDPTDYVKINGRLAWNTADLPERVYFIFPVPREVQDKLKRKLASLPYPVDQNWWVRQLIERDVREQKIRLPQPEHDPRYLQRVQKRKES